MKEEKRTIRRAYLVLTANDIYFDLNKEKLEDSDQIIEVHLPTGNHRLSRIVKFIVAMILLVVLSLTLLTYVPALLSVPGLLFGIPISVALLSREFNLKNKLAIVIPTKVIRNNPDIELNHLLPIKRPGNKPSIKLSVTTEEDRQILIEYLSGLSSLK